MSRVVVGVDPGLTGAVAVLGRGDLAVHDMPVVATRAGRKQVSPHLLREILAPLSVHHLDGELIVVIEEVHAMPKQGVSSMFSFGQSFGVILGVLAGLGLPYKLISPVSWMSRAGLAGKKANRDMSRTRALEIFPRHAGLFSLKKHHGRADAALLAWTEYSRAD